MINPQNLTTQELELCATELIFRTWDAIPKELRRGVNIGVTLSAYFADSEPKVTHSVAIDGTVLNGGSVTTMLQGVLASKGIAAASPVISRALPAPELEPLTEADFPSAEDLAEDADFTEVQF